MNDKPNSITDTIPEETIQLIRSEAFAAEQQGSLTPGMLDIMYKNNWLQIMVPQSCGGQQWTLPEIVRLLEAAVYADGNFGWTLNLCAGANLFAGYMEPEAAQEIFSDPQGCIAGSGAITGSATKKDGGYIINGRWKYATGSASASYFSANCYIHNPGNATEQNSDFRSFVIPAKDVTIIPAWNGVGMKATSSHDFEVKDVFVPDKYCFSLTAASPFEPGLLYRFPFILLAIFNITVMSTGLALRFLELFTELAEQKKMNDGRTLAKHERVAAAINFHVSQLENARKAFYMQLEESWALYENGEQADEQWIQNTRQTAAQTAAVCRALVNELYSFCGMSILQQDTAINKVWRDFMVASQHNIVSPLMAP